MEILRSVETGYQPYFPTNLCHTAANRNRTHRKNSLSKSRSVYGTPVWSRPENAKNKIDLSTDPKVDWNQSEIQSVIDEKFAKGPSITTTLFGKEDETFSNAAADYKGITDNTATKTVAGDKKYSFKDAQVAFSGVASNTATKTLAGSIPKGGTFAVARAEYGKIANASATKTLYGAIPSGGTFSVARREFGALKSDYATKTLYGSAPSSGGFTTAYNAFHSITSNYATKKLYGSQDYTFNSALYNYDRLKDKKVTVTTEGKIVGQWGGGTNVWGSGAVYTGGKWRGIPQYAGGTANAHGSMFIAGEAGPEVVGHIGGRTEVLNRSQMASTMSYAVSTGMSVGLRGMLSQITPRLAMIGQSTVRSEQHLMQLAQQAAGEAGAGGNARVIELLTQILTVLRTMDFDVYLDGVSVKDRIVQIINRDTQQKGVCEILV